MKGSDRDRKKAAAKEFKKGNPAFIELDLFSAEFVPKGMTRAYRNNIYTVMVYDDSETTQGLAIRVMIQKHNNSPIINHWSEIQKIKNAIFGNEVTAIEYYPKESELINDFNIYWIWIFEDNSLPIPIL